MTEDKGVAASWLRGLAARGITTRIVNGRIRHFPASAYRQLTDAELITLRHHRAEIKAVINAGASFDVVLAAPTVEQATPTPEPACPYCYNPSAACAKLKETRPDVFYVLHPLEAQAREDARLNKEFRLAFGLDPSPR